MRIVLILIMLWPGTALAGAWPRGQGNVFWAYSLRDGVGDGRFEGVYLEAGVSDKLTYLFEISRGDERSAVSSLTWHFAESDAVWQYAAGVGHGMISGEYSIRTHANLGRGWQLGEHSGWVTADVSASRGEAGQAQYKADFTLGRNGPEAWSSFAQLFMFWDEDLQGAHSVEVHLARPVTERFTLDVGMHKGLQGSDQAGLALSLWASF